MKWVSSQTCYHVDIFVSSLTIYVLNNVDNVYFALITLLIYSLLFLCVSDDKNGEWQVCEGLGGIAVLSHNWIKAIDYYKQAITSQAKFQVI